jgi:peptide chain release factor 1
VNKTDSAVRATHIPTGIFVEQQDDRSQIRNKEKAIKILKSRIYDMELSKQQQEISSLRKSQIGTGDRSEKIRTYNFPQNRFTEHRINLTLYKLDIILKEGILYEVVEAMRASFEEEKLRNAHQQS